MTAIRINPKQLIAVAGAFALALWLSACSNAPETKDVPIPGTAYQVTLPGDSADSVTMTTLADGAFPEITPLTVVQLNYQAADGTEAFLANVFVFDEAYWDSIQNPNTPGYGTEVIRQGGQVVSVQATVEMPFDPESDDGVAYGALAEALRVVANFSNLPD